MKTIILTDDEVRGVFSGRKTMLRRPVKWPVAGPWIGSKRAVFGPADVGGDRLLRACPFGVPGDALWVRECWQIVTGRVRGDLGAVVRFRSDWEMHPVTMPSDRPMPLGLAWDRWRSSTQMPRWASRLTLVVRDVRVERLQAITEADAITEGARRFDSIPTSKYGSSARWSCGDPKHTGQCLGTARHAVGNVWDSRYASKGLGWDTNPFVWVVSFVRVEVAR